MTYLTLEMASGWMILRDIGKYVISLIYDVSHKLYTSENVVYATVTLLPLPLESSTACNRHRKNFYQGFSQITP